MAFNLNDYEMVKDRIPLFYEKYSDGRITCDIITENADWVTMKAFLWKDMESQVANAPLSTGIAREIPGGFIDKYYENCETSAIGRALANLNMFDGNRPSREEMESAQSMQEARAMKQTVRPKPQAPSTPPPASAPTQQPIDAPVKMVATTRQMKEDTLIMIGITLLKMTRGLEYGVLHLILP